VTLIRDKFGVDSESRRYDAPLSLRRCSVNVFGGKHRRPLDRYYTIHHALIMAQHAYSPIADEKSSLDVAATEKYVRRTVPSIRQRMIGHFLPAVLLTSALLLLVRSAFVCHGRYDSSKELGRPAELVQDVMVTEKVALEAHIMSKCPDARDCLQQLVVPTMQQISDKVDFKISFIGR